MLRVYHYFSVRINVYVQKPKSSLISLCTILSFKSKGFMLYLQVITCSDDKKKKIGSKYGKITTTQEQV